MIILKAVYLLVNSHSINLNKLTLDIELLIIESISKSLKAIPKMLT